jgi:hypothetical protein
MWCSTHARESVDSASGRSTAGDRRDIASGSPDAERRPCHIGRSVAMSHWIARAPDRRTSEARRFSSPREDDDSGPPSAIRAARSVAMSHSQTRGDTTIPSVPGPTWTPSTALTSEITMFPRCRQPLIRSTSRAAPSGLSR